MSKKAEIFKNVYDAIDLDSNGEHQVAFSKYLSSLQALSSYLAEQYHVKGYQKMKEDPKETNQVLSLIRDCTDRVNSILNFKSAPNVSPTFFRKSSETLNNGMKENIHGINLLNRNASSNCFVSSVDNISMFASFSISRYPALEKVQQENSLLFKKYKMRLKNAKDHHTRANLQLELQRRLAENLCIAKAKYAEALKEQQNERQGMFEVAEKRLTQEMPCCSELDREKHHLYLQVLQYESKQNRLISYVDSDLHVKKSEMIEEIFQRTMGNTDHPLTQFIIMAQIKFKRKLIAVLKNFSGFSPHLQNTKLFEELKNSATSLSENTTKSASLEMPSMESSNIKLPASFLKDFVPNFSEEIKDTISDVLQIFYLSYKKYLVDDFDTLCYKSVESFLLHPLWPHVIRLCRLMNTSSEVKITKVIAKYHENIENFASSSFVVNASPKKFESLIAELRQVQFLTSLVDKLKILVYISHELCENFVFENEEHERSSKKLGVDDFIVALCSLLIQGKACWLVSECYALELLVDQKFMLGEEGYALVSFKTALKYLEMKKFLELDDSSPTKKEETEDKKQENI